MKTQPKFDTVRVRRIDDKKEMEMSRKVWENVHKDGNTFELAEKKEK